MKITFEVDDTDCANEVASSLRHEADSIQLVHHGTAEMLTGVAEQIEEQVEQDEFFERAKQQLPFIMTAGDYHVFDDMKRTLSKVLGVSLSFKELDNDEFGLAPYIAVFYTGRGVPKVTSENIDSFNKVQA